MTILLFLALWMFMEAKPNFRDSKGIRSDKQICMSHNWMQDYKSGKTKYKGEKMDSLLNSLYSLC